MRRTTVHYSFKRWVHHVVTDTIIGSLDAVGALLSCNLTIGFARVSLVGHLRYQRGSHDPAYGFSAKLVSVSRSYFAVGQSASFLCQSHFLAAVDHLAVIISSLFVDQGGQRHQVLSDEFLRATHASLLLHHHTSAVAIPDTSILSD